MRSFSVFTTLVSVLFCGFFFSSCFSCAAAEAMKAQTNHSISSFFIRHLKRKRAYLLWTHPLSVGDYVLFVDSCNTRKNFSFDGFEQCTTTSRYVRYAAGQTELVDTSYRVTATYQ